MAIAATKLAKEEDELVVRGLANAAGCTGELGDWDTPGGPFRVVSMATAQLLAADYDAPYALVLNPTAYARLASLMQHGRRELDLVERLVGVGIFQSTNLPDGQALVVSPASWNFDMVVGQDVVTAYLGNQGIDHLFRVFETLVLRVKRPGAICVLK